MKRNSSFRKISDNMGGGDGRKLERQQSITMETVACQSRASRLFDPGQKALALLMQDSEVGAFEASAAKLTFAINSGANADGRSSPIGTRPGLTRRLSGRRSPAAQNLPSTVEDGEEKEEKEDEVKPDYDWKKAALERTASQKRLDHSPRRGSAASRNDLSPRRGSDFSRAAKDKLTGNQSMSPSRRSSDVSPVGSAKEKRSFRRIQRDDQGTKEPSTMSRSVKGGLSKSNSMRGLMSDEPDKAKARRGSLHFSLSALNTSYLDDGSELDKKHSSNHSGRKESRRSSQHSRDSQHSSHSKKESRRSSNHSGDSHHNSHSSFEKSSDRHGRHGDKKDRHRSHSSRHLGHSHSSTGDSSMHGRDKKDLHDRRSSRHSGRRSRHSSYARNDDLQDIIERVGHDLDSGNHYWVKMIDQWVEQG